MRSKLLNLLLLVCCVTLSYGQTNVYDIARHGCAEDIKQLIKEYPDVINYKNARGHTALILACYSGNTEVAMELVKHVKNINAVSNEGTALMAATFKGDLELSQLLLKHGADVNTTDPNGNTALHYAVQFSKTSIIKLLVAHDADTNLKDARGMTAIDYAKQKDETVLKLLIK